MALTASTRQYVLLDGGAPYNVTMQTGILIGTRLSNKTITNQFESGGTYYVSAKATLTDPKTGLVFSQTVQFTDSWSQWNALQQFYNWSPLALTVNASCWVSGTYDGVYWNRSFTIQSYNVNYYKLSFTVSSLAVSGKQVGNVALYVNDSLVTGSVSKSTAGSSELNYSYETADTNTSSLPRVRVVATALSSGITNWHNSYYYNGVYKDDALISDSSIVFSSDSASTPTYVPENNSTVFVVDYGVKYAVTVSKQNGISSSRISYTRHHSTGDYVTTTTSPISLSGNGTLYVEDGSNLSVSASCSSGYVFSTTNGFISQTSGVSSIYGTNSASINGIVPTLTKAASFIITASTYSISVAITDHTDWGAVYIDTSGTTSKTLIQGTTYNFYFASSKDSTCAPTVAGWYVNGSLISGSSYTADALTGNISVTCILRQNAYPVTLTAGSNGNATVYKRYNKTTGAEMANGGSNSVCWLYADGRDYLKCSVSPNTHYDVHTITKPDHVAEYSAGGTYAYSLTSGANATIDFQFVLAECVVKTATNDPTLCEVSPASQTIRFDAAESVCVMVYCYIKDEQIGNYRVDYFTANGAQYTAEKGGDGQYYYAVYASTVGGNSEMTFVPHLVSTSNRLTVNKTGDTAFAAAYVQIGSGAEESVAGAVWSDSVRENTSVVCRAVALFGGQLGLPSATGIINPEIETGRVTFSMPSNDAVVNFPVTEKDKITISLQLSNITDETVVGKISLTAPQSSAVNEVVENTHDAQSFNIYKNTIYHLDADDSNENYVFTGWFVDNVLVSTDTHLEVNRSTGAAYVARYAMRTVGTVTVCYAIKSGDTETPTTLPQSGSFFGLILDPEDVSPRTPPDQTDPDRWIIGNNKFVNFKAVAGNTQEEVDGVVLPFIWTPSRLEARVLGSGEDWQTVWTYDATNPTALTGRFVMRGDMEIRLVFSKAQAAGYGLVRALLMDGCTKEMGETSVFATQMVGYYSIGGISEAVCLIGKKVVLSASPRPGYAFGGWYVYADGAYKLQESDGAVLTISTIGTAGAVYYASFIPSEAYVKSWNDADEAKTLLWRSKVYVGAKFFAMRNVRVYSDVYPVKLKLMTATSPNGCFADDARKLDLVISSQSPRHIPVMRLEKYFAFEICGSGRINHVALASSMEALK